MEPVILPLVCLKGLDASESDHAIRRGSCRYIPHGAFPLMSVPLLLLQNGLFSRFFPPISSFMFSLFFSLHIKSAHHDAQLQFPPLLSLNGCWHLWFYFCSCCFVSFLLFVFLCVLAWKNKYFFFYVAFEKGCVSVVWATLGTTNAEGPDFSDRWFSSVL